VGENTEDGTEYWRYLEKSLSLKCKWIAEPGASVIWAGDQILQCDIGPGDVVVWSLTGLYRFPVFKNNFLTHVFPPFIEQQYRTYITSEDLFHRTMKTVKQVVNFCKKAGATLVMFGTGSGNFTPEFTEHLSCYKNFIFIPDNHNGNHLLDQGVDFYGEPQKDIPGPLTHKMYADLILQKLQTL
jgi:hypothetical protein